MRIGIIGNGVVGNATARAFSPYHEVRRFDSRSERCTHSGDETLDSDLIFLCLPSPQKKGLLECDLSIIERQCSYLGTSEHRHRSYVLRSTVPIGTTRKLAEKYGLRNLVHSPEFLTTRTAIRDAENPTQLLIGSQCYRNGSSLGADPCGSLLHHLYTCRLGMGGWGRNTRTFPDLMDCTGSAVRVSRKTSQCSRSR